MEELLKEQLQKYIEKQKSVEAELVRKIKNNEDYSKELVELNGLNLLEMEILRMLKTDC